METLGYIKMPIYKRILSAFGSVSGQVAIVLGPVLAGILLLAATVLASSYDRQARADFSDQIKLIYALSVPTVAEAVMLDNITTINSVMAALEVNPDFREAHVFINEKYQSIQHGRQGIPYLMSEKRFAQLLGAKPAAELAKKPGGQGILEIDGHVFRVGAIIDDRSSDRQLGYYAIGFSTARTDEALRLQWRQNLLWAIASIVLLLGLTVAIVVRKTRALRDLALAARKMADQDFQVDVPHAAQSGEVGDMARALARFRDSNTKKLELEAQIETENLMKANRQQSIENAILSFEATVQSVIGGVAQAASQFETTARAMQEAATATTEQAASTVSASSRISRQITTVASATDSLAGSIDEIGQQISETRKLTRDVFNRAAASQENMRNLSSAVDRIGSLTATINTIAEQTNLLALNAAIEAARAGEAGKGFGVVAGEVKQLAQQTSKATETIALQTAQIRTETEISVRSIGEINELIERLELSAGAVSASIQHQTDASGQIAENVQKTSLETDNVTKDIAFVSAAANRASQATAEMIVASTNLEGEAKRLKSEVETFLQSVRRA
jgi:methyl-accepting chemotaxis protein